jgi:hypothetical protein
MLTLFWDQNSRHFHPVSRDKINDQVSVQTEPSMCCESGQQISWLAARSITHKFLRLFNPSLPVSPPETTEEYVTRDICPPARSLIFATAQADQFLPYAERRCWC